VKVEATDDQVVPNAPERVEVRKGLAAIERAITNLGEGPGGTVTKADVKRAVKKALEEGTG
ncbi:MAG: hypothetical protein ACRDQA_04310, partial [Nocardioidaceae bacterium]